MDFIKQVPISLLTVEERRNWRDRWEKVIACHSCYFNKRNGYFLYIFFFFAILLSLTRKTFLMNLRNLMQDISL